jgi:hypothetical protein
MEEISNRIKTAIEFLKDGFPFKVGELYLGISDNNCINVTGASKFIHMENINKEEAIKELDEIKSLFGKMISASEELKNFISDKQIKFNLDFDYGMGDVRICSEMHGLLKWEADIKR